MIIKWSSNLSKLEIEADGTKMNHDSNFVSKRSLVIYIDRGVEMKGFSKWLCK